MSPVAAHAGNFHLGSRLLRICPVMLMTLYLSRARLKREPSIESLAPLLLPNEGGERAAAAHRLMWSLFAGDNSAQRDFLFREVTPFGLRSGRVEFLILSRRSPTADGPLFDVEIKEFAPILATGDRLRFSLRANATVAHKNEKGKSARADVVMHALRRLPPGTRAKERQAAVQREGKLWLIRQAKDAGFRLIEDTEGDDVAALAVDGYAQWQFPKLGRSGRISVLDFEGILEVTEPEHFVRKLTNGIGRARSYGCGLMLIKRP
jgi:CRISPR system Cascade subunit CasE